MSEKNNDTILATAVDDASPNLIDFDALYDDLDPPPKQSSEEQMDEDALLAHEGDDEPNDEDMTDVDNLLGLDDPANIPDKLPSSDEQMPEIGSNDADADNDVINVNIDQGDKFEEVMEIDPVGTKKGDAVSVGTAEPGLTKDGGVSVGTPKSPTKTVSVGTGDSTDRAKSLKTPPRSKRVVADLSAAARSAPSKTSTPKPPKVAYTARTDRFKLQTNTRIVIGDSNCFDVDKCVDDVVYWKATNWKMFMDQLQRLQRHGPVKKVVISTLLNMIRDEVYDKEEDDFKPFVEYYVQKIAEVAVFKSKVMFTVLGPVLRLNKPHTARYKQDLKPIKDYVREQIQKFNLDNLVFDGKLEIKAEFLGKDGLHHTDAGRDIQYRHIDRVLKRELPTPEETDEVLQDAARQTRETTPMADADDDEDQDEVLGNRLVPINKNKKSLTDKPSAGTTPKGKRGRTPEGTPPPRRRSPSRTPTKERRSRSTRRTPPRRDRSTSRRRSRRSSSRSRTRSRERRSVYTPNKVHYYQDSREDRRRSRRGRSRSHSRDSRRTQRRRTPTPPRRTPPRQKPTRKTPPRKDAPITSRVSVGTRSTEEVSVGTLTRDRDLLAHYAVSAIDALTKVYDLSEPDSDYDLDVIERLYKKVSSEKVTRTFKRLRPRQPDQGETPAKKTREETVTQPKTPPRIVLEEDEFEGENLENKSVSFRLAYIESDTETDRDDFDDELGNVTDEGPDDYSFLPGISFTKSKKPTKMEAGTKDMRRIEFNTIGLKSLTTRERFNEARASAELDKDKSLQEHVRPRITVKQIRAKIVKTGRLATQTAEDFRSKFVAVQRAGMELNHEVKRQLAIIIRSAKHWRILIPDTEGCFLLPKIKGIGKRLVVSIGCFEGNTVIFEDADQIPESIRELLADVSIIKVQSGIMADIKHLEKAGIIVRGWADSGVIFAGFIQEKCTSPGAHNQLEYFGLKEWTLKDIKYREPHNLKGYRKSPITEEARMHSLQDSRLPVYVICKAVALRASVLVLDEEEDAFPWIELVLDLTRTVSWQNSFGRQQQYTIEENWLGPQREAQGGNQLGLNDRKLVVNIREGLTDQVRLINEIGTADEELATAYEYWTEQELPKSNDRHKVDELLAQRCARCRQPTHQNQDEKRKCQKTFGNAVKLCKYPICEFYTESNKPKHQMDFCPILQNVCEECGLRGHGAQAHAEFDMALLRKHFLDYAAFGYLTSIPYLSLVKNSVEKKLMSYHFYYGHYDSSLDGNPINALLIGAPDVEVRFTGTSERQISEIKNACHLRRERLEAIFEFNLEVNVEEFEARLHFNLAQLNWCKEQWRIRQQNPLHVRPDVPNLDREPKDTKTRPKKSTTIRRATEPSTSTSTANSRA